MSEQKTDQQKADQLKADLGHILGYICPKSAWQGGLVEAFSALRKASQQASDWLDEQGYDSIENLFEAEDEQTMVQDLLDKECLTQEQADILHKKFKTAREDEDSMAALLAGGTNRAAAPPMHGETAPEHIPRAATAMHERLEMGLSASYKGRLKHGGNGSVPPSHWGLTVKDFNRFINMCRRKEDKWAMLAADTKFGKRPGVVNGYQLCSEFVKPFTSGTGCGVSLLLNPEKPLEAEVMMSHTWAEDIIEVQQAVNDRAVADGRGDDLVIWFCIFAVYQAEDQAGPTITEQLKMDPFGQVIH